MTETEKANRRAMRYAHRALEAALEFAENEQDQRGTNDKDYPTPAKPVVSKLRTALGKIETALHGRARMRGLLGALVALSLSEAVTAHPQATNAPPPEPNMEPRDPEISPEAKRSAAILRRQVYEATRTRSPDDAERIAAAEAKRERRAAKRRKEQA